jgi:predicted nuclease of predicted toxin-antitoxin system
VKFLIDNALPPEVARLLANAGHDAVHVRDYGLQAAEDPIIIERAELEDRILVSADTDFAALLAVARKAKPSFILFREPDVIRTQDYANRILQSLPLLESDLKAGCVVVFRHRFAGSRFRFDRRH